MPRTVIDIRNASLDQFKDFVFDHAVHSIGSDQVWYHQFDLEIRFDDEHNARCFIKMLTDAKGLLSKYDSEKLEQGCWAMFSGFDGNLNYLIWDSAIPIKTKEDLIASMYFIYRDLFAVDPLGEACEMWWDGLAYEIHPLKRADPENNPHDKRIQDAMFEVLSKILLLESVHCQSAALHGLNHVAHPDTENIVKKYVESHPELSEADIDYAYRCAKGNAL
ncbi:hypothetical protein [Pseudaestuariivita rosea]|uniref:hypothetical protein n=1 Tax=Pseudaestuariivita rosea TaxID=2763263 RepID=UPI001ABBE06B|nr:hypothetical protein [Pseudaestuariivita rosea]